MSRSSPEWDVLLSAAQKNWADRIREMILTEGVNPSHSNAVGQTALHIAALWGNVEAVSVLVELGANINAQNNLTGASPLHMVAQSHKASIDARLQVAEILLDAGALADIADKYGSMPINLLEASTQGTEIDEKTKLLIAKLRPRLPKIHQAVIDRDLSTLDSLRLDSTLDVNETFQNVTPLSRAIRSFLEDIAITDTIQLNDATELTLSIIKLLLMQGADPNCLIVEATTDDVEDVVKEPALHKLACTLREIYHKQQPHSIAEQKIALIRNLIDLLFSSGSKVPSETILLLHQAARLNECLFATFLLDQLHIDPNIKGRQGMTPLHFAARSGKLEMMQLLLNREGIDVSRTDDQGKTAMHYAAVNAKVEAITLLEKYT